MARRSDDVVKPDPPKRNPRPSATVQGRENQLVSLAVDLAEKQIREGTASAQVLVHFLKLGSVDKQLERAKLEHETALLKNRSDQIISQQRTEEMYLEALKAMRSYAGAPPLAIEGDDDDEY